MPRGAALPAAAPGCRRRWEGVGLLVRRPPSLGGGAHATPVAARVGLRPLKGDGAQAWVRAGRVTNAALCDGDTPPGLEVRLALPTLLSVPKVSEVKAKKTCCKDKPRCKKCPVTLRRLDKRGYAERQDSRTYLVEKKVPAKVLKAARAR